MTIRAVLFDLDNTLFDHQLSASTGLAAFLQHHAAEPTDALTTAWFEVERLNYDRWLAGEISFEEQRRERLRHFLPWAGIPAPASESGLDKLFTVYLSHYEASWTAFPDAAETLRHLADGGRLVGVVTNGNHNQQSRKIQRIGLAPLLHSVFSSERMGYAKPAAQAFLTPCDSLQIPPGQVLYVGDNYRVDIQGALDAGLPAIHLDRTTGNDTRPHTIRQLRELPATLDSARQ